MKKEWTKRIVLFAASLAIVSSSTVAHAETINETEKSTQSSAVKNESATKLKTELVKFDTRIIKDKNLPKGIEVVVQKGTNGERTFYKTFDTTKDANGHISEFPVFYDEITTLPTEKVVRQGTNKEIIEGISDKTKKLEKKKSDEKKAAAKRKAEEKAQQEQESSDSQSSSDSGESNTVSPFKTETQPAKKPNRKVDDSAPAGHVTTPSENRAYVQSVLSPSEFSCADKLIMRESGYLTTADNPNSSAYGVPQALPGSKMASAGSDWRTNGKTQFKWMQGYVKERYGNSFCIALNHSYNVGWY